MKSLPLMLIAGGVALSAAALAADATFEAADRDANGVLSMAEVFIAMPEATPEMFAEADVDDDGRLTEVEYGAAVDGGVLPKG